jgi:hypothetical protein
MAFKNLNIKEHCPKCAGKFIAVRFGRKFVHTNFEAENFSETFFGRNGLL